MGGLPTEAGKRENVVLVGNTDNVSWPLPGAHGFESFHPPWLYYLLDVTFLALILLGLNSQHESA